MNCVDLSRPIEAAHIDGRVAEITGWCHASGGTFDVSFEGKRENALKPTGYIDGKWRVRNVVSREDADWAAARAIMDEHEIAHAHTRIYAAIVDGIRLGRSGERA